MNGDVVTPSAFRREFALQPLADRRRLVEQMQADLDLVERVTTGAELLAFRLHGAWANRRAR